jgi:hypothetical protein
MSGILSKNAEMHTRETSNEALGTSKQLTSEGPGAAQLGDDAEVLETDVQLSQSRIWRLQQEFYSGRGLRAWTEDSIPQYITNNPFIAEIYASIAFGFFCDCTGNCEENVAPPSPANPLRIVELGAGTGKFAFLFLRRLTELLSARGFSQNAVRYCLTDCSEDSLQKWQANPHLKEFVQQGILEFEVAGSDPEIKSSFLSSANSREPGSSVTAPLIAIANYVFDSLPQDAFVVKDGKLFEALVTTTATRGVGHALSDLKFSYRDCEVPRDRYPEPVWNGILDEYRRRLPDATFFFPVAALRILRDFSSRTDGRMLVLAADKGIAHEEDLPLCQGSPAMEIHGPNCFSQLVNFDAIAKYFVSTGGGALLPEKHSANLNICAFLQPQSAGAYPATSDAFHVARDSFGPDDLFVLLAWLNPHMEEMSIPQILAVLRLSHWDPVALVRLFPVLARQFSTGMVWRTDLRHALKKIWSNHFAMKAGDNVVAFYCGVILLELKFFEDALAMFESSQQLLGRSAATSYNMALCQLGLSRSFEALELVKEACIQDSTFEPARLLHLKLEPAKPLD